MAVLQMKRFLLRFSMSDTPSNVPQLALTSLPDEEIIWTGPGGKFYGATPDSSNFVGGGDFTLRVTNWAQVPILNFERGGGAPYVETIDGFDPRELLGRFPLQNLNLRENPALAVDITRWDRLFTATSFHVIAIGGSGSQIRGDVSDWDLASRVNAFAIVLSSVFITGDVSSAAWIPNSTMQYLGLGPSLHGDLSGWGHIPTYTTILDNPLLTANVVGWDLSSVLVLEVRNTPGLFGNSSGWSFGTPEIIRCSQTAIGGDISSWSGDFSGLENCWMEYCPIRYLASGWVATVTNYCSFIFANGGTLTQAEVDQILADARASEVATPGLMSLLQLQGNTAPSAAGAADAAWLISQGWTVTTD